MPTSRNSALDLASQLPQLLPLAIAWAQAVSEHHAATGRMLYPRELEWAEQVGVQEPLAVRISMVDQLPIPEDPTLRMVGTSVGLFSPQLVGLTLGHTILLRHGHDNARLISHELRHVQQYEVHGSIAAFLPVYLQQVVQHGYWLAPLEVDARAHEIVA